ncbi:MAG: ferritin-like domain-containing protein [Zetaproteobacteria bacterium]|nr:ferritin-like domain-containing protein [Zetaproteobacteria bacterium]
MLKPLFEQLRHAYLETDVDQKLVQTFALYRDWLALESSDSLPECVLLHADYFQDVAAIDAVGMPNTIAVVQGAKVAKRGVATREGRAAMMHAIAHIEFNAINLALDAMQRFSDMPIQYYCDWLRVAAEEAYHFSLVRGHLRFLGAEYGDFPVHRGLWEMCERTAHDVMARMALVPRVLEARGLDVTPGIQKKLQQAGDFNAVNLLDIIYRDEIGHVAIGNHWFRACCAQRGLDTMAVFDALLQQFYPKGLMGPFNLEAREQAGFSAFEMALFAQ